MPDGPSQVVARQLLDPVLHVLTDRPDQVVTPHLEPGVDRDIQRETHTDTQTHRHVLPDRSDQVVIPHLEPGVDRDIHKERETQTHRHRHTDTDTYCLTNQIKL